MSNPFEIYLFTAAAFAVALALATAVQYKKIMILMANANENIIKYFIFVFVIAFIFGEPCSISHGELNKITQTMLAAIYWNSIYFIGVALFFEAFYFKAEQWRFHWLIFFFGLAEFYLVAGLFSPKIME